jgi:uncharacterized UBP type Zn finger protein
MHPCAHIKEANDLPITRHVCDECIKTGDTWVHLRLCLTCGHMGCCDSSKNKHATKHFHETQHPIMRSAERGEQWGWCFADQITYDLSKGVKHAHVED